MSDLSIESCRPRIPSAVGSRPASRWRQPRAWLPGLGDWLGRHRHAVRRLQWGIIGCYLLLLVTPVLLPRIAGGWNLTVISQFVFWGVWWPFVLLSMVLVGRSWCGIFCPEGALTETVSRFSLGRAVPAWIRWPGWPFAAFIATTVYGQMVSVYQYPRAALLVLGGSTVAAVAVGLVYGRNKRVWCRYLCPVSGVFGLLAKLAPFHYRVDPVAWNASPPAARQVGCAPLVAIRTMQGGSQCHMCGRCSGFRDAVQLAPRSPNQEIVQVAATRASFWDSALILFGLMGVAVGAFHWSASPWFVVAKQAVADRLVDAGILWPLEQSAPWWLLTNYPAQNDTLTLLDGGVLLAYIALTALVLGAGLSAAVAMGVRLAGGWSWSRFHHLAQTLIPMAGCGVFLGLSATTVTLLRGEGLSLPWISALRALLLAGAALWSVWLAWRVAGGWVRGVRRVATTCGVAAACSIAALGWIAFFWLW